MKAVGITLASLAGFVLLYFAAVFCCSRIAVNKHPVPADDVTIYILTNGAHTDIVVPVRNEVTDWSETVSFSNTLSGDTTARYAAFGWGDKGFYLDTPTWDDLRFSTAFNAMFWLSTSAMHVTFYNDMTPSDRCKRIDISRLEYESLVRFIAARFQRDGDGRVMFIETDAVYGANDAFYEGIGRYNLFYTCNTWANDALKSCGQRAALWTIFDTGIFRHYQE